MNTRDRNTWIGLALVLLGAAALLNDVGLFVGLGRLLPVALFGGGAALVFAHYQQHPERTWALPGAFVLAGLALASLGGAWGGGAFLAAIGVGFLALYLRDRRNWWALIPAGVLMTLGVVATVDEVSGGANGGTVFFLGLAATFAALYLLPDVNQRWAIYPALALAVVAVLTLSFGGGWLVPLALIGVGAWLLTRQAQPDEGNGAAAPPSSDAGSPEAASPEAAAPAAGSPADASPDAKSPDAASPNGGTSGATSTDPGSRDAGSRGGA